MTLAQLNRICNGWIHRLNLDHWEIELITDEALEYDDGSEAEIEIAEHYEEAEIKLHPEEWPKWDQLKANKVIAHELLHIHIDKIKSAAEECRGSLGNDTWMLYHRRLTHELEHSVDALAVALSRTLGTV